MKLLRREDAERERARLAQQSGMVNSLIRADVIEAGELPEVGDQYGVSSVPKSIISEECKVIGALPEAEYLREFLSAADTTKRPGFSRPLSMLCELRNR